MFWDVLPGLFLFIAGLMTGRAVSLGWRVGRAMVWIATFDSVRPGPERCKYDDQTVIMLLRFVGGALPEGGRLPNPADWHLNARSRST